MARDETKRGSTNPLKDEGRSKESTREAADQAEPKGKRTRVDQTETGQGGSKKGGGRADSSHPSQHGGAKRELDETGRE